MPDVISFCRPEQMVASLPLTGVQNGQTNNLLPLIAYDDIIICEFTVGSMTRFFEIHI